MPTYSFKKNCKVYIVRGGLRWKLEVYPDLNFSQTFNEKLRKVKTLHDQNAMFDEATINTANPADFNFTVLFVKGSDFEIVGDWLTTKLGTGSEESLLAYDVYVDNGVDIFKLQKSVVTRGTFLIQREQLVTVSIEGQASKLTRFGASGTAIPGILQTRDPALLPLIVRAMQIELDGQTLDSIAGVSFELQNQVQWLEYDTLHKSLYVTNASNVQTPEAFVVSGRVLSGTIQQYLTAENNGKVQTFSEDSTLRIRVGEVGNYYLDLNIPKVLWTNRIGVEEAFIQNYDFRMTHNPTQVYTIINY